jgi:hypothetical protein
MPRLLSLLLAAALLAGLLAACSLLPADDVPTGNESLRQTDQAHYAARLVTGDFDRVVLNVPYRTRNSTEDTLYLTGCRIPDLPVLEKHVSGSWQTAYDPGKLLCWSPPWVLAPGDVRWDTLRVEGWLPGQNIYPHFRTEITGTYRLKRLIYSSLEADEKYPLGEDTIDVGLRVSNTFEVERAEAE